MRSDFSLVDTGRIAFLRVVMRLRADRPAAAVAEVLRADESAIRDATIAPFRRPADREAFLSSPFVVTPAPGGASGPASYYGQSATGAVAGLALAQWCGPWLVAQWNNSGLDSAMRSGTDWRAWAFASSVGVLTGLLCGLAAAFRATRIGPADALKSRGPRQSSPGGAQRVLAVAQLAFSVVVMVTSGLLLHSYLGIMATPALSTLEGVTVAELRLARSNIAPGARPAVVERARAAAAAIPGVVTGLARTVPSYGGAYFWAIDPVDQPGLGTPERMAMVNGVTASYFDVVGTEMLAGRRFDARDVAGAPRVAIANRTFARKYLGGETRIPQRVRSGTGKDVVELEVVGIAADQPDASLLQPSEPTLFLAREQDVVDDGRDIGVSTPSRRQRRSGRRGHGHQVCGAERVGAYDLPRSDSARRVRP